MQKKKLKNHRERKIGMCKVKRKRFFPADYTSLKKRKKNGRGTEGEGGVKVNFR